MGRDGNQSLVPIHIETKTILCVKDYSTNFDDRLCIIKFYH